MAVQRTLIGNIKGPKGDKGDTGDTGSRGAGATVTIGSITTTAYGGNASVTNSGTETDAVLDFVLPQGAPGETVTDMEDLTLSSMTTPSVQFPIPSIGDTGKVIFGKITKWFSDMTALVATKLNAANVVNNLTTTASGYALDARQGKALNDKLAISAEGIYGTYGDLSVKRAGNIITYQWHGNSTVTPTTANIGTLSADFRPTDTVYCAIRAGDGAGYLQINTNGAVALNANGNAWSVGSGAYVAANQY